MALDSVGAGVGEHVFFVRGREAAFPFYPAEPPTDAAIVGIVDHWDLDRRCDSRSVRVRRQDTAGAGNWQTGSWKLAAETGMQICRVVGTVVATQKNRKLEGAKLLLVQPLTLDGQPRGVALIAIDSVGAGVGERVLVVIEGKAAGDALGRKAAAVDAAIIGIVDVVDYRDDV